MAERPPHDELSSRRNLADVTGVLQSPERFAEMMADEKKWTERLPPDTEELRTLLGLISGMLVQRGAHPRLLADYIRETLRHTFPSGFDAPIP
jgi:hypothetical protein